MGANSPEEICRLFQTYMAEGNLELLLSIYDAEAVFLNQSGELKKGRQGLREVLAPLAAAKTNFDFTIIQIIQSGDIALMHTRWRQMLSPQPTSMHAIEVARRQADGTWCWLIGDPFTISKHGTAETVGVDA
jgi:uncharacterized protein (TIGR02246 family)